MRIRSASRLDFGQHHPNIQSVRTGHRRTWDYVGKDGDIVYEIGDPPDPIGGPSGGRGDSVWSEAVRAESEEEFYFDPARRSSAILYPISPTTRTIRREVLWSSSTTIRIANLTDLTGPRIAEWKSQATIGDNGGGHRRRSLILWGPTRTGKTVWARSLGTLTGGGSAPAPPFIFHTNPNGPNPNLSRFAS